MKRNFKRGGNLINKTGYTPGYATENNPLNIIPGSNITMENTPYPVTGLPLDSTGNPIGSPVVMQPGRNYKFGGASYVAETKYKEGGEKNDWISKKIGLLIDEGYPQDQAIAIATSMYENYHNIGGVQGPMGLGYYPQQDPYGNTSYLPAANLPAPAWNQGAPISVNQPSTIDILDLSDEDRGSIAGPIDEEMKQRLAENKRINTALGNYDDESGQAKDPSLTEKFAGNIGLHQFYNPYGGVDMQSSLFNLGRGIENKSAMGIIPNAANVLLKGSRDVLAGVGSARRQNQIMKTYEDKQRQGMTQQNMPKRQYGGYFQGGGTLEGEEQPDLIDKYARRSYNVPEEPVVATPQIHTAEEAPEGYIQNLEKSTSPVEKEPTTFGEAFRKNRAKLGPGKVFEWRGKQYTTNYASESASSKAKVATSGRPAPKTEPTYYGGQLKEVVIPAYDKNQWSFKKQGRVDAKPYTPYNPNLLIQSTPWQQYEVKQQPVVKRLFYQEGGQVTQEQQGMEQQIAEALQQGANPEEIMQYLVQQGMPQEQAMQMIQAIMQQMGGAQQATPQLRDGGCLECGGYYQEGGQQGGQDLMMQVAEALQQGVNPESLIEQLIQSGVSHQEAMQMVQSVMQQMGGGQPEATPQLRHGGYHYYQEGGEQGAADQQVQQIVEQVGAMFAQMLESGMAPEEAAQQLLQQLVEAGMPEDQAMQIIQMIMSQAAPQGAPQDMQQQAPQQTGGEQMGQEQAMMRDGGEYLGMLKGKTIKNYTFNNKTGNYEVEYE